MKIIRGFVKWYAGFSNKPELNITVDKIPKMSDLVYEQRGGSFTAHHEGYVDTFWYTKPGNGFGGREFNLNMIDGSKKKLIGPFSSNSATVNSLRYPFGHVFEVSMKEEDSDLSVFGMITVELARKYENVIHVPDFELKNHLVKFGNGFRPNFLIPTIGVVTENVLSSQQTFNVENCGYVEIGATKGDGYTWFKGYDSGRDGGIWKCL